MTKKKLSIILKQDYLNIGHKGKIISVSFGYAVNYLIPNKIAEPATKNKIKHLKMLEEKSKKQIQINENTNNKLKKQIENIDKISMRRKKGDNNYIFGRITEKDIVNYIHQNTGIKLDKKQIKIPIIKQSGVFQTQIEISHNISLILKLNIFPLNV